MKNSYSISNTNTFSSISKIANTHDSIKTNISLTTGTTDSSTISIITYITTTPISTTSRATTITTSSILNYASNITSTTNHTSSTTTSSTKKPLCFNDDGPRGELERVSSSSVSILSTVVNATINAAYTSKTCTTNSITNSGTISHITTIDTITQSSIAIIIANVGKYFFSTTNSIDLSLSIRSDVGFSDGFTQLCIADDSYSTSEASQDDVDYESGLCSNTQNFILRTNFRE